MSCLRYFLNAALLATYAAPSLVCVFLSCTTLASGPKYDPIAGAADDNEQDRVAEEAYAFAEGADDDGRLWEHHLENGRSQRMIMNDNNYAPHAIYLGLPASSWLSLQQALLFNHQRDPQTTTLRFIQQEGRPSRTEVGYHGAPAEDHLAHATVWEVSLGDDGRVRGTQSSYGAPLDLGALLATNLIDISAQLDVTLLGELVSGAMPRTP